MQTKKKKPTPSKRGHGAKPKKPTKKAPPKSKMPSKVTYSF